MKSWVPYHRKWWIRTLGAVVIKGIRGLDQVIFPTLEILLLYDGFGPSEFENSVTCKYIVQQLEFLDEKPRKTWGQNWTLSVGCPSQGLFALYHHYPKKGLPVPQSGHCRLKEVSGSSLTSGDMNRIWQGVRRSSNKHPQQLSFSLPPLLNLSTLRVPLPSQP